MVASVDTISWIEGVLDPTDSGSETVAISEKEEVDVCGATSKLLAICGMSFSGSDSAFGVPAEREEHVKGVVFVLLESGVLPTGT